MNTLKKVSVLTLAALLCSCTSLAGKLASTDPATVEAAVVRLVEREPDGITVLNRTIAAAPQPRRERIFDVLTERYVPDRDESTEMKPGWFLNSFRPVTAGGKMILDEPNTIRFHVYTIGYGIPLIMYPELTGQVTAWCLGQFAGEIQDLYRLRAIPYLVEALDSAKTEVRMTSLLIIRGMLLNPYAPDYKEHPEEASAHRLKTWKSFLGSGNALLRALAADVLLGEMTESELAPVLEEAYSTGDECVKFFAAQCLTSWFGRFAALRPVVDAIRSEDPYIQRWALILPTRTFWYFDRSFYAEDDIEYLVKLAEGDSPRCWWAVALLKQFDKLAESHTRRIAAVVRRHITSDSAEERWSASGHLERLASPENFDLLVRCLHDESEHAEITVRCAADALGALGDRRVVPYLVKLLSRDDSAGWSAAYALSRIGDTSAVPHLISALEERLDAIAPWSLLSALGELGDKRAIPVLQKALKAEHMNTREYAVKALAQIKDPAVTGILVGAAEADPEEYVRKIALNLVLERGGEEVKALLLRMVEREQDKLLSRVLDGIEKLCPEKLEQTLKKVLDVHLDSVGVHAAAIAAAKNYKSLLPVVEEWFGVCRDTHLRSDLARILARWKGEELLPLLETVYAGQERPLDALFEMFELDPAKYHSEVVHLVNTGDATWASREAAGVLLSRGYRQGFSLIGEQLTGPHRSGCANSDWKWAYNLLKEYFEGAPEYDEGAFWTQREKQYEAIRKFWLENGDKFTWDAASRKFIVPADNR